MSRSLSLKFVAGALLVSALACNLMPSSTPSPAAVTVTLPATPPPTETSLAAPTTLPPTETSLPAPATLPPTDTPLLATPTSALPEVSFNGIHFRYDPALATNVTYETVPASQPDPNGPYWETYPQHTHFLFNGYVLSGMFHQPEMWVYPLEEYIQRVPDLAQTKARLQEVLGQQPTSFSGQEALPFLPVWNAQQLMQMNVRYLHFANGQGVRFISIYGQYSAPANNHDIFYTFQGMTDDGKYYISLVLPVNNPALPNTAEEGIPNGDFETFTDHYMTYVSDTEGMMNGLVDASFTPSLEKLDALVQSLQIIP